MIEGIDLSHNNENINFDHLSPDIKFVILKVSQGGGFKDDEFQTRYHDLKGRGIIRGAYHFLTATVPAAVQAKNFLDAGIDFNSPGVLPPILDVEDQVPASLNAAITRDRKAFIQLIKDWCAIVEQATGRKVMLYSYRNFFHDYLLDTPDFGDHLLWLAAYQSQPPQLPPGFKQWHFWQFSERGSLKASNDGGDIDHSYFYGTQEQLNDLANERSTNLS